KMLLFCMIGYALVYGVGVLLSQILFTPAFDTPIGFGLILGAGFIGGHAGATAIGHSFSALGWEEALTLGYTSATIGLLLAVLGGMILIKRGTERNETAFIKKFDSLPSDLKTGLVDKEKRQSI